MMAQGAVAPAPTNGVTLTAEELREILEYERIVQFRDAVLAGTHPRVKIPPHLAGKHINSSRNVSSPSLSTPRAYQSAQPARSTPGSHEESSNVYNRSPNSTRQSAGGHLAMTSKSEINPILLEKSDDLIKAEIQLQRQRLERALREQIEQQRITAKALLQTSESLPNFDISEVLSKALAIVHPSTTAEAEPSVGVRSSASDSFDENTFYSSQHDTPEPSSSSQGQKEPAEQQSRRLISVDDRPSEVFPTQSHVGDRDLVMTGASLSQDNHLATQRRLQTQHSPSQHQASTLALHGQISEIESSESNSSRGAIAGDTSVAMTTHGPRKAQEDLLKQAFGSQATSPLVRAHNLSPVAPQPARVSPLATAREPPILREPIPIDEAHPAQVSALRNKATGISSTDSSPKGGKASEKKKDKKKKKRKAKESGDTPDSPYIKPEPRSPSPYAVAPLPRPQKRQRQSGQYTAELNYDEPRNEPEVVEVQERILEQYKEARAPRAYDRYEDRYEPEIRRPEPTYRHVEREDEGYRRVSDGHYALRPQSPTVFAVPYTANEVRPARAASHAIMDRRVHEEPRYYREPVARASVRPDADRERSRSPVYRARSPLPMGPPRQPVRIVIDEYGRKYYDPGPAPSLRQSVAPPTRYRDAEVVYERAPIRTVSGRVPAEAYEEDGVIYRRPSPEITVPRRAVTQPEYTIPSQPEYRSYRQREYSVRPAIVAPGDEYIQIRGAPERRQMTQLEETPREYVARAPSVRPEPVRYEIPREYVGRLESVRPEQPPREYAASVHPETRREMVPQSQREYSVRPIDTMPRREHMPPREGERYYEDISDRRLAEVAFIERPRARESSVLVYADDVRREVYR